jgi:hypothetical protein
MGAAEICTLLTRNLASITPEEISAYAAKVFLTVGAEADFHYFLPALANDFWSDSPRQQDFKNWLIRLVDEGAINTAYEL